MNYIFIFGRDPVLSFLEIVCYLKRKDISYLIIKRSENFVIMEVALDLGKAVSELGGTVKIAKEVGDVKVIQSIVGMMPGKVFYSLQNFDDFDIEEIFKQEFKRQKIKAQNITFKISPSEILKKNLIEVGSDFVYAMGRLFQTVAVSNPQELKKRDIGRPVQDVTGAISLRLAKILINLSQIKKGALLDPFCGIGSILQEALLMGVDCIGVDASQEKIEAAWKNMGWLKMNYSIKNKFELIKDDARKLSRTMNNKVQAIVTEPYLGDLIRSKLSLQEAEERIALLTKLYKEFFEGAYKILEDGGKMVIILPYFEVKKKKIGVPIEMIKGKFHIQNEEGLIPLSYRKATNKIGREIYILMK